MGTSSRAPEELSREELENEVTQLRELEGRVDALESLIGTLGGVPPEEAGMVDVKIGGNPLGKLVDQNTRRLKDLDSQAETEEVQLGGKRAEMLPVHRMYGDLITDVDESLNDTQRRAARLFGEFAERVVSDEFNKVDASGQGYSLKSGAAEDILLGKHSEDSTNYLKGVKKASRSQLIARAMRDVARLSKFDDCPCESIDDCTHSTIKFDSGRPNRLTAPKKEFNQAMAAVYNSDSSRSDSTTRTTTNTVEGQSSQSEVDSR